ncbi:hypothetical protein [Deinococcus sp. Leaf326]|uniref:hypothetical protein n=1 Tax=Deinococcus sp. Leaf326 TaxID=1736338 RepID=UPI0006F1F209|nr:hypothetical protein [Deinococcus sp. Leaf326]KQR33114.1 hypothetical protein ASF71_16620 [Deinococcus sp. Leaf326]
MSDEQYWITTPEKRRALPGTLKPEKLAPFTTTRNLVRAHGFRQTFDLSDGLPDPEAMTLTGKVYAESEAALSLWLRELRQDLRRATSYDRDGRRETPLLGADLVGVPTEERFSWMANLTLTLILAEVPDPDSEDGHDF